MADDGASSGAGVVVGGGGGFCRDAFFNATQSWETDDPSLSSCFQKTLPIWLPCAVFWVVLPAHLRVMFGRPSGGR